MTKTALAAQLGIFSRKMEKIGRGEKIVGFFGCPLDALCKDVSDNLLLQTLRDEKSIRMLGSLYLDLQVRMTYNSNHIEESKLSEDQIRLIFETNTIDIGEGISVNDIIETVNQCCQSMLCHRLFYPVALILFPVGLTLRSHLHVHRN